MKKYLLILLGLGLLAYLPFVGNQLFWDDEQFIYNNVYVKTFAVDKIFTTNTIAGAGEISNYYRPLTTLSFAIDHQFWGLNPVGYHLTNVALHTLAGMVLFLVLIALGLPKIVSLMVSAIFLVHPLQTEAVAYANSRGDSLYTLLGLVGLWCLIKLIKNQAINLKIYDFELKIEKMWLAAGSVLFYLLSILAKEIGIAVLGLYGLSIGYFWLKKQKIDKLAVVAFLSSTLLAGAYLILRFTLIRFQPELNLYLPSSDYGASVLVRLLTFTKVVWIYISLIFAPLGLHMERETEVVTSLTEVWPWLTLTLLLALGISGLKEWQKLKTSWIWLGAAWFFIPLIPVSGIFPVNGLLYEHWLYLPLVGWAILIFGLINFWAGKFYEKPIIKQSAAVLLAIYLILTWKQNYIWANPIRFYNYTLQHTESARVHNNLAMAYAEGGHTSQAVEHYQQAINLSDVYPQTHFNLGNSYVDLGELEKAEQEYLTAIQMSPQFFQAHLNLIGLHFNQQNYSRAMEYAQQAISIFPNDPFLLQVEAQIAEAEKLSAN